MYTIHLDESGMITLGQNIATCWGKKFHAYKSETILFFNSDWVLASSDKRVLKFSYIFSDFFLSELYIHSLYLINLVCYLIFCKEIFIKISEKAVKLFEVS